MRPIEERFWEKVDTTDVNGCWPWLAHRTTDGYGRIAVGGVRSETRPRMALAHRVAWEFCYGEIPAGLCVLHHCDNPPCCRPDHLWLGTDQDNSDDKMLKGRASHTPSVRGEDQHMAKLTRDDVLQIRQRIEAGEVQAAIAHSYSVSAATICLINKRRNWGWL